MGFSRDRISIGEAANDGKGTDLNLAGKYLEDFMTATCMFLNAGTSEIKIPDTLPIERGGTNASTVSGHIKYVTRFGAGAMQLVDNKYTPVAFIVITNGSDGTVKPLVDLSNVITVTKIAVGKYLFSTFNDSFKVMNDVGNVIRDKMGNQLFGYIIRYNGGNIFIDCYALKFDTTTGNKSLDLDTPIDMPPDNALYLTIVNTLGVI